MVDPHSDAALRECKIPPSSNKPHGLQWRKIQPLYVPRQLLLRPYGALGLRRCPHCYQYFVPNGTVEVVFFPDGSPCIALRVADPADDANIVLIPKTQGPLRETLLGKEFGSPCQTAPKRSVRVMRNTHYIKPVRCFYCDPTGRWGEVVGRNATNIWSLKGPLKPSLCAAYDQSRKIHPPRPVRDEISVGSNAALMTLALQGKNKKHDDLCMPRILLRPYGALGLHRRPICYQHLVPKGTV